MTPTFGMVAAGGGLAMTAAAAVADPATSDALAPYVGGGAGVLAVAALVEVTRRLLKGQLIPRDTAEGEEEMRKAIEASGQREDRIMRLAEEMASSNRKAAEDLRDHTARIARDLADVTQRQTTQITDHLSSLARAVQDMREDMSRRRGGSE